MTGAFGKTYNASVRFARACQTGESCADSDVFLQVIHTVKGLLVVAWPGKGRPA